jgi:hypothetical protein
MKQYSCTLYSCTRTRVATHVPATRTDVPATHVLAAHVRVLMYYVPVLLYNYPWYACTGARVPGTHARLPLVARSQARPQREAVYPLISSLLIKVLCVRVACVSGYSRALTIYLLISSLLIRLLCVRVLTGTHSRALTVVFAGPRVCEYSRVLTLYVGHTGGV